MDVNEHAKTFKQFLSESLKHAKPNGISLILDDGQTYAVYGSVFIGTDFIQFQPQHKDNKPIVTLLSRIKKMAFNP